MPWVISKKNLAAPRECLLMIQRGRSTKKTPKGGTVGVFLLLVCSALTRPCNSNRHAKSGCALCVRRGMAHIRVPRINRLFRDQRTDIQAWPTSFARRPSPRRGQRSSPLSSLSLRANRTGQRRAARTSFRISIDRWVAKAGGKKRYVSSR